MAPETHSPYRLDSSQTLRATTSLLNHIHKPANDGQERIKRNLLAEGGNGLEKNEAIWLVMTTKTHIVPQPRLKPGKIFLPHSLNDDHSISICLITPDPQRAFKDLIAHPSFPVNLAKKITRVIDIKKLQKKYRSFESRRQLRDSHDIFLADDRILTYLSKILGQIFYDSALKRPIPVHLQAPKHQVPNQDAALPSAKPKKKGEDKTIVFAETAAREIERSISATVVKLSPSVTTSVRVGLSSQSPEMIAENIDAVVGEMVKKYIPRQWRGIQSIHIKGPNTMALPIWLASELWADDGQVMEDEELDALTRAKSEAKKQKRLLALGGVEQTTEDRSIEVKGKKHRTDDVDLKADRKAKKARAQDEALSLEMKERRDALRQQKQEIRASLDKQS